MARMGREGAAPVPTITPFRLEGPTPLVPTCLWVLMQRYWVLNHSCSPSSNVNTSHRTSTFPFPSRCIYQGEWISVFGVPPATSAHAERSEAEFPHVHREAVGSPASAPLSLTTSDIYRSPSPNTYCQGETTGRKHSVYPVSLHSTG